MVFMLLKIKCRINRHCFEERPLQSHGWAVQLHKTTLAQGRIQQLKSISNDSTICLKRTPGLIEITGQFIMSKYVTLKVTFQIHVFIKARDWIVYHILQVFWPYRSVIKPKIELKKIHLDETTCIQMLQGWEKHVISMRYINSTI